jgi:hypothetical protein
VRVHLRREARILVTHDPLHRRQVGAAHQQQRRGRVAKVMKPDLADPSDGEQF